MGSTQHAFHFTVHLLQACVCTPDVCMIVCRRTCACQKCTCQIWNACILACMQIVSQGQRYKLYEDVHVLKYDSPHDTRRNPAKEFLHLTVLTAFIHVQIYIRFVALQSL